MIVIVAKAVQVFCSKWLQEPEFNNWLEAVNNEPRKAECKTCNKILFAGKTDLKKHSQSQLHQTNIKKVKTNRKINQCLLILSQNIKNKKPTKIM